MTTSRPYTTPPPPIRAARKSEWLRSALAHHFTPDPGVENEIVVLATGIDQYLQEIFHHLAFYSGDDLVSKEDFRLLCSVLGMSTTDDQTGEVSDVCSQLPNALLFKEFHSRLCGFFTAKAQGATPVRLPVTEETEHVEREIRIRWPRMRRRKCVSFDLSQDKRKSHVGQFEKAENLKVSTMELSKETGTEGQQRAWQEQVELENASLRELVEDLRSALQSSDARCMALEVALRRERLKSPHKLEEPAKRTLFTPQGDRGVTQPKRGVHVSRRRTKDLLRELELIRASRDGQLEEAMRFSQRLEEELASAYGEVSRLEEVVRSVRRESGEIKKRAEQARSALAAGLDKVRDIQGLAQQVGPLQEKVQELEAKLERFRSQCTCRTLREQRPDPPVEPVDPTPRVLPTGQDETFITGAEGLQRAVEGRAASDEEEEDRGKEEGQCCLLEAKHLINRLHNCAKGCQKNAVCHLLLSQSAGHYSEQCGCAGTHDVKSRLRRHHVLTDEKQLEKDLQLKQGEVDSLRLEVQVVETERVRLSLLEEKLTDALSLLLQLRDKRVSRRTLGKILLDTLDLSRRKGQDPTPVIQVVETLCRQLLSSDILNNDGGGTTGSRGTVTPGHRNMANPLLISC